MNVNVRMEDPGMRRESTKAAQSLSIGGHPRDRLFRVEQRHMLSPKSRICGRGEVC